MSLVPMLFPIDARPEPTPYCALSRAAIDQSASISATIDIDIINGAIIDNIFLLFHLYYRHRDIIILSIIYSISFVLD